MSEAVSAFARKYTTPDIQKPRRCVEEKVLWRIGFFLLHKSITISLNAIPQTLFVGTHDKEFHQYNVAIQKKKVFVKP